MIKANIEEPLLMEIKWEENYEVPTPYTLSGRIGNAVVA